MSNYRSTAVWKLSTHKETAFIALLAYADRADDDGYCWPSQTDTATRSRTTRTYMVEIDKKLVSSGELYIHKKKGKGNKYLVLPGLSPDEIEAAMYKRFGYPDDKAKRKVSDILTRQQSRHPLSVEQTPPVSPGRHEPSITINEPSGKDIVPPQEEPKATEAQILEASILSRWKELFPKKTQPKAGTHLSKIDTQLSRPFRKDIFDAMQKASQNPLLVKAGWFQLRWLLVSIKGEYGTIKVLEGKYNWMLPENNGKQSTLPPVQQVDEDYLDEQRRALEKAR